MKFLRSLLYGALLVPVFSLPHSRRQLTSPPKDGKYDFVIIGGGTAGLTIADRLTAAFPRRRVLVIEYGVIEEAVPAIEPPGTPAGATGLRLLSEPLPALNNRQASLLIGMSVGGSTTINGQFFDRPCRYDLDDWRTIGGPEFDRLEDKWGWDGVLPYFKKVIGQVVFCKS
jgi:choline dehydrogenase-like flavoprotein